MYDIVFLSYGEILADEHWRLLKDRFRRALRVDGISPIVAAHKEAARRCRTRYFWIVDADNIVEPSFDFSFYWQGDNEITDCVAVWRAKNSINGLVYGYGGVKLLPRKAVLNVSDDVVDFTTSISDYFHAVPEIASVTDIDTSEFDAWRAGFREASKLASRVIVRQNNAESQKRLDIWCTVGGGKYGHYAVSGAQAGKSYALNHGDLSKINDWKWLKQKFQEKENANGRFMSDR